MLDIIMHVYWDNGIQIAYLNFWSNGSFWSILAVASAFLVFTIMIHLSDISTPF